MPRRTSANKIDKPQRPRSHGRYAVAYEPTEEEIVAGTAAVRETWSEATWQSRARPEYRTQHMDIEWDLVETRTQRKKSHVGGGD